MGLVYSTEKGRLCPGCSESPCQCKNAPTRTVGDGFVRVGRETKGRKGAGVTTITGLPLDDTALMAFCTLLKKRCGTGGTLKDGVIEIQGDHRDKVITELTTQGYKVKRVGG
ncbi:MAG: translation initiation factor Sui1 [Armatimonadetes bacterium]|nr:translation initiation factor Sui1 [Armatimonadota bacterium]